MDKQQAENKIYVTMIGSAPMASIDALIMSLDRFKNMLSSDSARDQFETAVRSIQTSLKGVHTFIDAVYANKDPRTGVTMKGRTLVIEINLSAKDFYDCVQDHDVDDILAHVTAVGSLPATKLPNQPAREYTVFPVKYVRGNFIKSTGVF